MLSEKSEFEMDWIPFKKTYEICFSNYFEKTINESAWQQFSIGFFDVQTYKDEEKQLILKRFQLHDSKYASLFLNYLYQICHFQNREKFSYKTNFVLPIINFSVNKIGCFYVILSQKTHPLKLSLDNMFEIDLLSIVRNIVKLYFHLHDEREILSQIYEIGVSPIDINTMCYYRKFWFKTDKKLPRYKLKLDFLNFFVKNKNSQSQEDFFYKKSNETVLKRLHLSELAKFIRIFSIDNWGVSMRTFLNRIENRKDIDWIKVFANPLFLQSIGDNILWDYWAVSAEDRAFMKKDLRKATIYNFLNKKKPLIKELLDNESPKEKTIGFGKYFSKKSNIYLEESDKCEKKIILLNKGKDICRNFLNHEKGKKSENDHMFIVGWITLEIRKNRLKNSSKEMENTNSFIQYYKAEEKNKDIEKLIMNHKVFSKADYVFILKK